MNYNNNYYKKNQNYNKLNYNNNNMDNYIKLLKTMFVYILDNH